MSRRVTRKVRRVLTALLAAPDHAATGIQICTATTMWPGTVYPILDRLLENDWVTYDPSPGRGDVARYWRLTPDGTAQALEALEEEAPR